MTALRTLIGLGDHSRKREKIAAVARAVQRCAALLTGALLVLGCGADRATRVLRLGHGLDPTHPVHQAMESFATDVETASGGSLEVRIYPSEQLGSERECLELLQIGSLDITKVSAAVLESFAPAFRVLSLPYLFVDEAPRFAVLEGAVGEELRAQPRDARLLGVAFYDAGSRSFYTVERPITSPADLRGLKIRTQESATAMEMVRALGGSPTPISWGELYTSLQQGVVDGAENNPPSFHLSRHYEIARYYTLDEHTAVPDVLVISTEPWRRLGDEERQIVKQAALRSAELQRTLWAEATEAALRAVAAAGVEILRPDKGAFARQVEELIDRFAADEEAARWIRRIRSTGVEPVESQQPKGSE